MTLLKRLLLAAGVLAVLGLGALFAMQNTAVVPLDLLVVQLPGRSLALWVLLAFAVGGVVGMLANLGLVLRLRLALRGANRRLAQRDKLQLDKLQRDKASSRDAAASATTSATSAQRGGAA